MFRLIIAGSRSFHAYDPFKQACDHLLKLRVAVGEKIVIISGTARGADSMGERYAKENGFELRRFPADWEKHGKRAGYLRNIEMAKNADALLAFWDGESRGTAHMIDIAKQYKLFIRVKRI